MRDFFKFSSNTEDDAVESAKDELQNLLDNTPPQKNKQKRQEILQREVVHESRGECLSRHGVRQSRKELTMMVTVHPLYEGKQVIVHAC